MTNEDRRYELEALTSNHLAALVDDAAPLVAIVPVGAVEPHGPHLGLGTDNVISRACAVRACGMLAAEGVRAFVAPSVSYGVTRFAAAFAGAVSVDDAALRGYLRSVVEGLLATGFDHVCIVNNHLEPGHDTAVRAAIEGVDGSRVSVACPLSRRWGRTLSEEFKSGACHAGSYETSIVMAADPGTVVESVRRGLPEVPVSLSRAIAEGSIDFVSMGMDQAYAGAPARASVDEGHEMIERLAEMVATEVCEAIGVDPGRTT